MVASFPVIASTLIERIEGGLLHITRKEIVTTRPNVSTQHQNKVMRKKSLSHSGFSDWKKLWQHWLFEGSQEECGKMERYFAPQTSLTAHKAEAAAQPLFLVKLRVDQG